MADDSGPVLVGFEVHYLAAQAAVVVRHLIVAAAVAEYVVVQPGQVVHGAHRRDFVLNAEEFGVVEADVVEALSGEEVVGG